MIFLPPSSLGPLSAAAAAVEVGAETLLKADATASNGGAQFTDSGSDLLITVPSGATARNAQALSAADYYLVWPVLDAAGDQATVADAPALVLKWSWTTHPTEGMVVCPGFAAAANLGALSLVASSRWLNLYSNGGSQTATQPRRNTDTTQTGTLRTAPGPAFYSPLILADTWLCAAYGQQYGATQEANVYSTTNALTATDRLFAFLAIMPWVSPSADRTIQGQLTLARR